MQGQLFSQDFLARGILETPAWQRLDAAAFGAFQSSLQAIYQGLDAASTINEAQTEALVITKVLEALGWGDDLLPQVNLSGRRREDLQRRMADKDAISCPYFLTSNESQMARFTPSPCGQRHLHILF